MLVENTKPVPTTTSQSTTSPIKPVATSAFSTIPSTGSNQSLVLPTFDSKPAALNYNTPSLVALQQQLQAALALTQQGINFNLINTQPLVSQAALLNRCSYYNILMAQQNTITNQFNPQVLQANLTNQVINVPANETTTKQKKKDDIPRTPSGRRKYPETRRKTYTLLTDDAREQLIKLVKEDGLTIKAAATSLGLNYSTAKTIFHVYRKEGRIKKKRLIVAENSNTKEE